MKLRREPAPKDEPPVDRPTGADVPTAADARTTDAVPPGAIEPDAPSTRDAVEPPAKQRGLTSKGRVRHTRASALWVGVIVAAILTIFLLIFIAQNSQKVAISFLGFEGQISLAVALLLAAAIGVLVVALPGSLRIMQLRRALRKNAN